MVWEFPAVSQTRIEFWRKPQFTQSGMWWFTLFLGFFGAHHLYLRSPQTAVLFFILNFLTMGYLWAYDLVQLSSMGEFSGPNGLEALNKHGLSYAFGPLGLAQGMWKEPESLFPNIVNVVTAPEGYINPNRVKTGEGYGTAVRQPQVGGYTENEEVKEEERQYGPPPEPIYFLLYFFTILISPLAKAIAGDYNNSFTSIMNLTLMPFGFYFYIIGLVYDIIILMAYPAHLFVEGCTRGIPYTWMWFDRKGHSPNITGKSEIDPCPPQESFITAIMRWIIPIMKFFPPTMFHGTMLEKLLVRWDDGKEAFDKRERIMGDGGILGTVTSLMSGDPRKIAAAAAAAAASAGKAKIASAMKNPMGQLSNMAQMQTMPQVPGMPPMPKVPGMPPMPKVPGMPPMPQPGMPPMPKIPGMPPMPQPGMPTMPQPGMPPMPKVPGMPPMPQPAMHLAGSPYGIPLNKTHGTSVRRPLDSQSGGAINTPEPTFSLLDYTALGSIGAVIAGGLLLSANRFRNVFTKGDDSPPKPRTV